MEQPDMAHAIVPRRTYAVVFAALLVLTYLTVQMAFLDLGRLNTIAALTIAAVKALLVALFFMHLKYASRLTRIVMVGGLSWLLILLTVTFTDYITRAWRTFG